MKQVQFRVALQGINFSPKSVSSLPLTRCTELGEIGNTGRFKGLPRPFGAAQLELEYASEWSALNNVLDNLERNFDTLCRAGVEMFCLRCDVFAAGESFACDLSESQMQRLIRMKTGFIVDVWPWDMPENPKIEDRRAE